MKPKSPKPQAATTGENGRHIVRLEYANPAAEAVFVAGSFNEWHPSVTEMINMGHGIWAKELALLPGTYEYRLVVDGEWMTDPRCTLAVTNPFGGENSVLSVDASR